MRVECAELGDWGSVNLIAEYDPVGPTIRVSSRAVHADLAIAHELYHHREAIGEIPRLRDRAERERAADAFAAALIGER